MLGQQTPYDQFIDVLKPSQIILSCCRGRRYSFTVSSLNTIHLEPGTKQATPDVPGRKRFCMILFYQQWLLQRRTNSAVCSLFPSPTGFLWVWLNNLPRMFPFSSQTSYAITLQHLCIAQAERFVKFPVAIH